MDNFQVHVVAEHRHDIRTFIFAQQTVIHKNTSELVTNRSMKQGGRNGRIHATRQRANDMAITDLFADLFNRDVFVGVHRPIARESGDTDKVLVQFCAARRVVDFGVELNAVKVARRIRKYRVGRVGGRSVNLKPRCDFSDVITVGHPDLLIPIREPSVQKIKRGLLRHLRATKFGSATATRNFAALNVAAQLLHHRLLAVTNAQNRNAHGPQPFGGAG